MPNKHLKLQDAQTRDGAILHPGRYYRCRNGSKAFICFIDNPPFDVVEHNYVWGYVNTGPRTWHKQSWLVNGLTGYGTLSHYDLMSLWEGNDPSHEKYQCEGDTSGVDKE